MVPAHCRKKGVIERGPGSISHKVSVGSASKHLGEARVQHGEGAVFTHRSQEGSAVWREHQPGDTLGVHSCAEGTACTLGVHKGDGPILIA